MVVGATCGATLSRVFWASLIAHGTHTLSYAFLGFTETILGIGVAWLISFVPKLIRIDETDSPERVRSRAVNLSDDLDD